MTIPPADPTRTPWLLAPTLEPRPWGGRRLAGLAGGGDAPAGPIGEAWLAGPDSLAVPAVAPAAPPTRVKQLAGHGPGFVGSVPFARYGARMPLLSKLLDAAEPLSVQVHPDDAYAERFEAHTGHLGKSEAWLILAAEPAAYVLWGCTRSVTPDEMRAAIATGELEALLRRRPVRAGDVIVNEAGVIHAVGPGVLLFELQQASDLTYRLYDYDRRDAHGAPRALHVEQALAVAELEPAAAPAASYEAAPGRTRLAATDAFTLERWAVGRDAAPAEQHWRVDPRSLELWTLLEGVATLHAGGLALQLGQYQTVVLPAALGAAAWRGDALLARGTA
jgi:mannose-6-phosphate isomerase